MKKLFVQAVALTLLALPALAEDGWEQTSAYNQHYNTRTVQTVTGKVVKIDRAARPLKGMQPGFVVTIQPESGQPVEAQVGPQWFTQFYRNDWNNQVGYQVTLTGSLVDLNGRTVMMVRQSQKDGHKLTVRDAQGRPMWDVKVAGI